MAVHFINMTRDEFLTSRFISKYMSLENGLKTMRNHEFWFANPAIWPDPFERRFIEAQYHIGARSRKFAWKDRVYCACFTDIASNEAAWKVYTDKSFGVEFTINRVELLNALDLYANNNPHHNVYIGKVEYMQTKFITKSDVRKIPFAQPAAGGYGTAAFKAKLLMLKRKAFSYENEIRVIVVRPKASPVKGITVPFADSNLMFENAILDPNMGDELTSIFKSIIPQAQYMNCPAGASHRVLKSQIYSVPSKASVIKA